MNALNLNRRLRNTFAVFGILSAIVGALPAGAAEPSQFVSLSARGQVGSGQDVLIGGFVIAGSTQKQVLIRVAGPALESFGVGARLTATKVSVYSGNREIASNQGGPSAADLALAVAKLGTFPFPSSSLNSALIVTLDPGAYTAVVSAPDGSKGIALLEVYELPPTSGALLTPENEAKIQQLVDTAITKYSIPGIMYSIKFLGEQPWSRARGVRDTTTRAPLQPDDYFRIGSASKTFTGMAALKVIQTNALNTFSLDSPISQLVPTGVINNYNTSQITIRMLLNHTSGINSYTNDPNWFNTYVNNRTAIFTDAQLVQIVNSQASPSPGPYEMGTVATPGAIWYYSNTNTVLLGMILEKLKGKPIRQILQEDFFTPLGLTKTYWPAPGESVMREPYAHGYMNWANYLGTSTIPFTNPPVVLPNTDVDVSVYDPSGVGAAGAIVSTTGDLSRWIEAVANFDVGSSEFRPGHMDRRYYTAFSTNPTGAPIENGGYALSSYGMNIAHEPDPNNTADYNIVGHRGQISGYDTAMMYLPDLKVAMVVVCTRSLLNAPAGSTTSYPSNASVVALNDMVKVLFPKLIADSQARMPPGVGVVKSAPGGEIIEAQGGSAPARRVRPLSEY
jgi:D-alanyl-D-alanine carboxypeptidase